MTLKAHFFLLVCVTVFLGVQIRSVSFFLACALAFFVVWRLLCGSRIAWWIQFFGLFGAVVSLLQLADRLERSEFDPSPFANETSTLVVATIVTAAWLLLLVRPSRAWRRPLDQMSTVGVVVCVLFMAGLPSGAFGRWAELPEGENLLKLRGATLVHGEPNSREALYIRWEKDGRLRLTRIDGGLTSHRWTDRLSLKNPNVSRDADAVYGFVPANVGGVKVRTEAGTFPASMFSDARFFAQVYFLEDVPGLDGDVDVIGYGRDGQRLFSWPHPNW